MLGCSKHIRNKIWYICKCRAQNFDVFIQYNINHNINIWQHDLITFHLSLDILATTISTKLLGLRILFPYKSLWERFHCKSLWTTVLYMQTPLAIRIPYRGHIHLFLILSIGCGNVADELDEKMDEPTYSCWGIARGKKPGILCHQTVTARRFLILTSSLILDMLTPVVLTFSGIYEYICIYIIYRQWDRPGSWEPSPWYTRTRLSCIFYSMVASAGIVWP